MKCIQQTIFLLLIPLLIFDGSSAAPPPPPKKSVRNGKFMAFTADDMFSDLLDDVQDPIPIAGAVNQKSDKEKHYRMNDTIRTTTFRPKVNDTKMTKLPHKTEDKIALYNQDTGKFELITATSGHFAFPLKPVNENGVFFYGGQHYQYRRPVESPPGSNKTEEIKIFWSSIGDAVDRIPFLPIQINVPDMISAMTNFLVNYIPFINRFSNPNNPRVPYQARPVKNFTDHHLDYYEHYDLDQVSDNTISRRELVNGIDLNEKSTKGRKKNKRKSNKKKNSPKATSKRVFQRFRKTTVPPLEDLKLWHQFGSDQKETLRLKNMPITRKRIRVADREVFNFKNSDISNSPIMILNVPQRPITHYKLSHQELRDSKWQERYQPKPMEVVQQQPSQQQPPLQVTEKPAQVKQRRKNRNQTKSKRSSKRSGRSEASVDEPEASTKPVS